MITIISNILFIVFIAFLALSVVAIAVQLSRAVREFRAGYAETEIIRVLS